MHSPTKYDKNQLTLSKQLPRSHIKQYVNFAGNDKRAIGTYRVNRFAPIKEVYVPSTIKNILQSYRVTRM